jgi:hypothetical protein
VTLAAGDFYRRREGAPGAVSGGPTQAFLTRMPRAFQGTPRPAGARPGSATSPRLATDFTYADVEPWLKAEPSVRRALVPRWRQKAREPAFRAALLANRRANPEWDAILFPRPARPRGVPRRRGARRVRVVREGGECAGRPASRAPAGRQRGEARSAVWRRVHNARRCNVHAGRRRAESHAREGMNT